MSLDHASAKLGNILNRFKGKPCRGALWHGLSRAKRDAKEKKSHFTMSVQAAAPFRMVVVTSVFAPSQMLFFSRSPFAALCQEAMDGRARGIHSHPSLIVRLPLSRQTRCEIDSSCFVFSAPSRAPLTQHSHGHIHLAKRGGAIEGVVRRATS